MSLLALGAAGNLNSESISTSTINSAITRSADFFFLDLSDFVEIFVTGEIIEILQYTIVSGYLHKWIHLVQATYKDAMRT